MKIAQTPVFRTHVRTMVRWSALVIFAMTVSSPGCTGEAEIKARHEERARQYIAQQQYEDAVIELKNLVQLEPQNDAVHYLLGETYMKMRNVESAAESFGNAINANPDNLAAHFRMGSIFLAAGRPMEARMAAKLIIEKTPDNIDAYGLLAGVQVQENNLAAAVNTLQKALAIAPQSLTTKLYLAHLLDVSGRIDEAQVVYEGVIADHPSHSAAHIELIGLYGRKGQWGKARAVLDGMNRAGHKDYPKIKALAALCERNGKWAMAEDLRLKGVESAPGHDATALMDLGAFYARRKAYKKAVSSMEKALSIRPNDPAILADIGRLNLDSKDIPAAESAVARALEIDGDHAMANFLKGEILFSKGEYGKAIGFFDLTITRDPDHYKAYYYKALCLLNRGVTGQPETDLFRAAAGFLDDTEAWIEKQVEKNLLKALALNSNLLEAKLALADFYLRRGSVTKARKRIESALEQAPGRLKTLTLLGSLKLLEKDFKGAEALCLEVLATYPDLSNWHTRLGFVYRGMDRQADALAAFQKAIELNPLQFPALRSIVEIHLRGRKFEAALDLCARHKRLVKGNGKAVASVENMEGTIYLAWGKPVEARRHFERVIPAHPDFIAPRMSLAGIHVRQGRTDDAISMYENVLRINGDFLPACVALGRIHSKNGDKKQAEKYYRRALAIKPGYGPVANNLAFLLSFYDDKIHEALKLAQDARLKMPHDPTVKDTLGWIYYRVGQYQKAAEELKSSLARDPDNALANFHLGLTYYRQNDYEEARVLIKRALALDPDFEGAAEARTLVDD